MAKTTIEWADFTFNPWWGCTKVSPACDNCYAATFAKRVGAKELCPECEGSGQTGPERGCFTCSGCGSLPIWGKGMPRRFFGDKHWGEPLKWDKAAVKAGVRKRVFCASMADVMEDRHDLDEPRQRLYRLIESTPNLDWLLLTKRPQNFRRFLPAEWLENPRPNVVGMTTVESEDYAWRIKALLETPFAVRALSMEPLLGPVDVRRFLKGRCGQCGGIPSEFCEHSGSFICNHPNYIGLDQIITGSESGHGARETDIEWVRSLKNQCVAADVAFFYKQGAAKGRAIPTPELDGRTWMQFPGGQNAR